MKTGNSFCLYGVQVTSFFTHPSRLYFIITRLQVEFPDIFHKYITDKIKNLGTKKKVDYVTDKLDVYQFLATDLVGQPYKNFCDTIYGKDTDTNDNNSSESIDIMKQLLHELFEVVGNLDMVCSYEVNLAYIGRSFSSIGDNETGTQLKRSTEETLSRIFLEPKCKIYEGCF